MNCDMPLRRMQDVQVRGAVGTVEDVKRKLNTDELLRKEADGTRVNVFIVDTGIHKESLLPQAQPNYHLWPGPWQARQDSGHANYVAFDVLIAAPRAHLYDYPLLAVTEAGHEAFLTSATHAFRDILDALRNDPNLKPAVVVNCWGAPTDGDAPPGRPENYSHNENHPLNEAVRDLGQIADVIFAAGNDGIGSGNNILGVNSHPDALCVAAAMVNDELLNTSSHGPGALYRQEPDITGFSNFQAGNRLHTATSTACPVVAGVVAAFRSTRTGRNLTPAEMKDHLLKSARKVNGINGWNRAFGHGIINASKALDSILN